jgi:hypothetical protein
VTCFQSYPLLLQLPSQNVRAALMRKEPLIVSNSDQIVKEVGMGQQDFGTDLHTEWFQPSGLATISLS